METVLQSKPWRSLLGAAVHAIRLYHVWDRADGWTRPHFQAPKSFGPIDREAV